MNTASDKVSRFKDFQVIERPPARMAVLITFRATRIFRKLVSIPSHFFSTPLSGQCLLRTTFVTRLQVKGVFFDVFDDVFLLHLALESPQSTFD